MHRWKHAFWALLFPLGLTAQVDATQAEVSTSRILFVLDASNSMYGRWDEGTKMEIAQRLMSSMLDSLSQVPNPQFQLALRVYGHQKPVPPQDCNDTKLEVGFADNNLGRIKQVIRGLRPMGTTPIARSILRADNDFPKDCPTGHCRDIIILITDGVEACDEDPCEASAILQKKGRVLKPFVIGVGLDKDLIKAFDCVGTYYDASDETTFKKALGVIVTQALDNTTGQINLVDQFGKNSGTNLPILLRNATSHLVDRSIIHTMNYHNQPDTLLVDPIVTYEGTVYSIPPRPIHETPMYAGKHNHLAADVVQGGLKLTMPGLKLSQTPPVAVLRHVDAVDILHVQTFNSTVTYIVDTYDLDILTLPRIRQRITLKPGTTQEITIPPAGEVTIQLKSPGFGAIFAIDGSDWEWVTPLDELQTRQQFSLQPGTYKVIYRPRAAQQTTYSKTQTFIVSPGSSTLVRIL
jgi:Ca-activated chloride channel family protein